MAGVKCPEAGVTGYCEPNGMGSGNPTWVWAVRAINSSAISSPGLIPQATERFLNKRSMSQNSESGR